MGKGKYSPALTRAMIDARDDYTFIYNALGQIAPERAKGEAYDEKVHFANYDAEGFDLYGYSAWNADGTYAGMGDGIDRLGYTEFDYIAMSDDEFNDINNVEFNPFEGLGKLLRPRN